MKLQMIILFFLFFTGRNEDPSLAEVRSLYNAAVFEENKCRKLIDILDPYQPDTHPVYVGYKASAIMLMAKHVFNPVSKLKYFNRGKDLLEKTIALHPENAELRMLRFLAQSNIPKFLGYNSHLEEDKDFLLRVIPKIKDPDLKDYLVKTLLESEEISKAELLTANTP